MTMTRKDYRVIADALIYSRPTTHRVNGGGPEWQRWLLVRNSIASELNVNNRNFDRGKFEDWTEK